MEYTEIFSKIFENVLTVYTVPQIAKILHTSNESVRKLIKSGELRALKQGELKVSSTALLRFLTENEGYDLSDPFNKKILVFN